MLKRTILLLLLSAGSSLTAMEWVKSKLGYGPKQETYEESVAAKKRSMPPYIWYINEVATLPKEWPADKNEQQRLVAKISEFAEKYESLPAQDKDFTNQQVDRYLLRLPNESKKLEVMRNALREYRRLKEEAELKKLKARL